MVKVKRVSPKIKNMATSPPLKGSARGVQQKKEEEHLNWEDAITLFL